jgi:hypothetical protein
VLKNKFFRLYDKIDSIAFNLDHYGVVFDPIFARLLAKDSDRRKRAQALRQLERLAKDTGQIPKGAKLLSIGLTTDEGGELYYEFQYTQPKPVVAQEENKNG